MTGITITSNDLVEFRVSDKVARVSLLFG